MWAYAWHSMHMDARGQPHAVTSVSLVSRPSCDDLLQAGPEEGLKLVTIWLEGYSCIMCGKIYVA